MTKITIPRLIRRRAAVVAALVTLAALLAVALVSAEPSAVTAGKTVDDGVVAPGAEILYTVVFTNTSGSPVQIVALQDTLPAGFQWIGVGAGSQISDEPNPKTGTIFWPNSYQIPANNTLVLKYRVQVNAPPRAEPYTNYVVASLQGGTFATDWVEVQVTGPYLGGAKTASASQVPNRSAVDYTVSLQNTGTSPASLTSIVDTLPAQFSFKQMISGPLPNPNVVGNTLTWTSGWPASIAPGGTLVFSYRVTAVGTIGQTYQNSVVPTFNSVTSGPFRASVKILAHKAYLPLVNKNLDLTPPTPYRLVYQSGAEGQEEVHAIDADGANPVNVSNNTAIDVDPTWSHNGSRVAWVRYVSGQAEIVSANADGSGFANLTNNSAGDRAPDWSPTADKIAFHSIRNNSRWEVYVMNGDGSGVTNLTADRAGPSRNPVWSHDGTKIAFVCGVDNKTGICVMDANGANQVRLTNDSDAYNDYSPSWSPDGTKIVFVRDTPSDTRRDLFVVTVPSGNVQRITDNNDDDYAPCWSPDGLKIAAARYMGSSVDIVIMNPDGSGPVNLTNAAGLDDWPRWSPDGTKIAFRSKRDGGEYELYVMNADGTNVIRLTNTAAGEGPVFDWQPASN